VRTVHLVHFYSAPGGIEVLSSRLLDSFDGYSFRVFVIRPRKEGQPDVYEGTGVPVSYGARSNLAALFRLWLYARRHRGEIFHLFNVGPFFLMSVRLAGVHGILYSIRGTKYWADTWQRIIRRSIWRVALSENVRVIANSGFSRRVFLEDVCPGKEIKVIYNPVGSARFVPSGLKRDSGVMKIVYVGRLNSGKNLDRWIDVAVELHSRLEMTRFEIYGSGPLHQALQERIGSHGAGSYIALKGYRRDIENVFRDADLLLFLSEYESFGNVVVESILCGTPVIASDIPSMREIFRDYPLFLVSAEADLCDQIAERLRDYGAMLEEANVAGNNFRERFSEEAYINSIKEIYSSFHG